MVGPGSGAGYFEGISRAAGGPTESGEGNGGPAEAELVAAAQRGDRAAIAALLTRYEGPIYRLGVRLCSAPGLPWSPPNPSPLRGLYQSDRPTSRPVRRGGSMSTIGGARLAGSAAHAITLTIHLGVHGGQLSVPPQPSDPL
jgi:hypothetical protein